MCKSDTWVRKITTSTRGLFANAKTAFPFAPKRVVESAGISFAIMALVKKEGPVRKLLIATCVLLVVMWLACTVEFPRRPPAHASPLGHHSVTTNDWRRTVDGWERASKWQSTRAKPTAPPAATYVHPGLIASFQILVSLGSLLAFSGSSASKAPSANQAAPELS